MSSDLDTGDAAGCFELEKSLTKKKNIIRIYQILPIKVPMQGTNSAISL